MSKPKTRCEYCRQPNYVDELVCRFCGGSLPTAAIPSIGEGQVEKAFCRAVTESAVGIGMYAVRGSLPFQPRHYRDA